MRLVTGSEKARATVSFFALWSSGSTSTSPGARCPLVPVKLSRGTSNEAVGTEELVLELKLQAAVGVEAEV